MEENTPTSISPAPKKGFLAGFGEFARFTLIVIVTVILFRAFIAQPFVVSGTSMVPTFQDANYLIVDEISYRFTEPKRGEVVVFKPPYEIGTFLIKRIIGLPGDQIQIKEGVVTITNDEHPEGLTLSEPYVNEDYPHENYLTTVPDDMYFVMGDNRAVSYDSRKWGFLPKKNIIGRAFLRLFPVSKLDVFPGSHTHYQ